MRIQEDENRSPEEKVLQLFHDRGDITRKDIEINLSCSKFTAIKIVNQLIEKNVIVKIGAGRSVKYRLV